MLEKLVKLVYKIDFLLDVKGYKEDVEKEDDEKLLVIF